MKLNWLICLLILVSPGSVAQSLSTPKSPVKPLPESVVKSAIERVRNADTKMQWTRALQAVERMGLPALPTVYKESLVKNAPSQQALEDLARRLACIVRRVEYSPESAKPDTAVGAEIAKL